MYSLPKSTENDRKLTKIRHNKPHPLQVGKLTFDFDLESGFRVTWATSVSILVFPDLSVVDLGPMYATERQTSDSQTSGAHHRLMPPPLEVGHNNAKKWF